MRVSSKDKLIVNFIDKEGGCASEKLILKTLSSNYEQKYYIKKRLFLLEYEGIIVSKYIYNHFEKRAVKYYCFPE